MIDVMSTPTDPAKTSEATIRRRIDRAVAGARLIVFWERLWPRLVPLFVVAGIFILASWLGLWPAVPDWLRFVLLGAFAIAALAALWPLTSLRVPSPAEAFIRLERWNDQANRPATGILDHLATPHASPETQAIWEAHRARLLRQFGRLRLATPSPGMADRDPYALRFLLLLLLVVGLAATGGAGDRIGEAFRAAPASAAEAAAVRVDAWASPPDYTGRPAIFLSGERAADEVDAFNVPEGTEIFVRVSGEDAARYDVAADGEPIESASGTAESGGPREFRATLAADQRITITGPGGEQAAWSFTVAPDEPPTIAVTRPPTQSGVAGLEFAYAYEDDYGVTAAYGEIALADPTVAANSLYGPPEYELAVPRRGADAVEADTVHTLERHPWAGLDAVVTLVAEDAIAQTGRSSAWPVTLPARSFTDPLAIALVAQRQVLALDKSRAVEIAAALDLFSADAARRDVGPAIYLALRSAYHRLMLADSDDLLRGVVDYLWEIAVGIEGDRLADATAALQAATEELREAMARGAGEEELAQLTEEVRAALQEYMEALAEAPRETQQAAEMPDMEQRPVTAQDLEEMLERIEELAEMGDMVSAEELVAQLQQMMQDLQTPADGPRGREPSGEQQLGNLGQLLQDQQRLMDQTYGLQQQQNAPQPMPATPADAERQREEFRQSRAEQAETARELQQEQERLGTRVQDLIYELLNEELDPAGLEDAADAMAAAADRLEEQRPGMAVERQAEALAELQAVAESLSAQIARQQQGDQPLEQNLGGGARDPIGRPTELDGQQGDAVDVPDDVDRQLAREILDLIRQRLNDPGRPPIEIDYLERLIDED